MDYVYLSMISSTISEQHSAAEVAQDGDTRYKREHKQIFRQLFVMFNEQLHKENSRSQQIKWHFMSNPLPEDYSPKIFEDGNHMELMCVRNIFSLTK